jgi:hypothetical protein
MNDWVDTPAFTLDGWGHYHERYVFEDGAWRIADERITRLRVVRTPKRGAKPGGAARAGGKKTKARAAKPAARGERAGRKR